MITVALGVWAAGQTKHDGRDGYFLTGRSSHPVIVAVSAISGLTSGISVLGVPGFVYGDVQSSHFGFIAVALSYFVAAPIMTRIIIPFYCELRCVTIYTYLEVRFCQQIRTVVSCLFLVKVVCYLALVLYAPSIVIEQFLDIPGWCAILVFGCVTTLITMKGGMSCVIWTDFIQSIVIVTIALFSLVVVFSRTPSADLHRAMVVSPDFWKIRPTHETLTVHSALIGYTFANIAQHGCDQVAVQKYLATRDVVTARFSCFWGAIGNGMYVVLSCLLGAALRACYGGTGALPGALSNVDAVYMFFVETELPKGAAGFLIGGVFGCTISVFSAGLNSAAASIVLDLLPVISNSSADRFEVAKLSQRATLAVGTLSTLIALCFAALRGELIKTSNSFLGLTFGPILGVFALGMLTVRTNWQGVGVALATALPLMFYIGAGQILCMDRDQIVGQPGACSGVLALGSISPYWCCAVLSLFTFVVGLAASCLWEKPIPESIRGLTLWTREHSKKEFSSLEEQSVQLTPRATGKCGV